MSVASVEALGPADERPPLTAAQLPAVGPAVATGDAAAVGPAVAPGDAAAVAPAAAGPAPGRLVRNLAALFGAQLVTWSMTLVWTLIVPRLIGPSGLGVITTAQSVAGVMGVMCGLASSGYLVREMVMRPDESARLLGTALVVKVMLIPVIAAGTVAFAAVAHYSHEQTIAIYLAAIMSVGVLIADAQTGAFQSREQMQYMAMGGVVNKTGQSLLGISAAALGLGALGIVANMAFVAFAVVAIQFVWLRGLIRIDLRTNLRQVAGMVKRSSTFLASGLFFTFYLWIDTVMLSLMTSAKVVGWYAAATTLVTTFMFLPIMLQTSWLPRLVVAFKHSPQRLFAAARTPIEQLVVLSAPITVGVIIGARLIMHILYGSAFIPAAAVMVALAFCIPPTYFNMMMVQVYIAAGRQKVSMYLMGGAAVFNPLVNLWLIPLARSRYHDGAIGAAVALDLTELGIAVASIAILGRHIVDRSVARRTLLSTGAAAWTWAVTAGLAPLGEPVALAGGAVIFVLLAFVLRIPTAEEIRFVRGGLGRLSTRMRLPSKRGRRRIATQEGM